MTDDSDGFGAGPPAGPEPTVRSRHDWSVKSASGAAVAAVAVAADRDPLSLVPLHERVDPGALDDLFSPRPSGRLPDGLRVTFGYEGFEVTVQSGGTVTVREGDPGDGTHPR